MMYKEASSRHQLNENFGWNAFLLVATAIFLLAQAMGCVSTPAPQQTRKIAIPFGRLDTAGFSIAAEDGSWVIRSGEQFKTPFYVDWSNRQLARSLNWDGLWTEGPRNFWRNYLKLGAQRVRVMTPQNDTLKGILALEMAELYCWEQVTQAYSMEIPERYLEEARGGGVSVVYDKVGCSAADRSTTYQYTWILWLSKKPFGE